MVGVSDGQLRLIVAGILGIEGVRLRNSALIALGLGFTPIAGIAWYFQSNHLLWLSLTLYMATLMVALGIQVPRMHKQ